LLFLLLLFFFAVAFASVLVVVVIVLFAVVVTVVVASMANGTAFLGAARPTGAEKTSSVVKTVYLIRHGEALHNVLEQQAKHGAAAEAHALGLSKGTAQFNALVVEARRRVLNDETLADAELTPAGEAQAEDARRDVEMLAAKYGLPLPTRVLVSPLQRALQTAGIIFPDHPCVQVHSELRERRTGLPCDQPSSPKMMKNSPSFSSFDFSDILSEEEATYSEEGIRGGFFEQEEGIRVEETGCMMTGRRVQNRSISSMSDIDGLEDASQLRLRTFQLIDLLSKLEDEALCVVTHKGYLRELERGPFGQSKAPEFGTAEVRVYDVLLSTDGLATSLRYCRSESSFATAPVPAELISRTAARLMGA